MIIGLTGSVGSGKTTVAKMFSGYGYAIIDADRIGHSLLNKKEVKSKIIKEFGTVNRKKLSSVVFSNKPKLNKLNKMMWPLIGKEIKSVINKKNNVIIDAAVLIEANWHRFADKVVVVKINRDNQIKRLLKSKKYDKELIRKIISLQLPQNKKLKYADYIIDNNKSLNNTKRQIVAIINKIKDEKN